MKSHKKLFNCFVFLLVIFQAQANELLHNKKIKQKKAQESEQPSSLKNVYENCVNKPIETLSQKVKEHPKITMVGAIVIDLAISIFFSLLISKYQLKNKSSCGVDVVNPEHKDMWMKRFETDFSSLEGVTDFSKLNVEDL